jgi:toxin FitB
VRPVDLYLSVVTIGEIEKGIAKQRRRDPAFARRLAAWLDGVLRHYAARVLPVDVNVARRWGRLADAHGHAGADLLIAATALEHGLTVVTRNTRHFERTGAVLLDPCRDGS